MQKPSGSNPFQHLGGRLKALRQKLQESVAEVSGAVEIDSELLELIERGIERPSEDVLMLLISHFNIADGDAVTLWQLAGYDAPGSEGHEKFSSEDQQGRLVMLMMALDTRVLYSDSATIVADKNGVVLNFLQNSGTLTAKNQHVPIARIGMSHEQAHDFVHQLAHELAKADESRQPKGLPSPKPKHKKTDIN